MQYANPDVLNFYVIISHFLSSSVPVRVTALFCRLQGIYEGMDSRGPVLYKHEIMH